ncbi:type II toxin-antitoxin system VapC family toxin [Microvirga aerophila]|uniref:Ribonuclease VapC n=1 Tax=Microvirga aerophila TaxID=670291 RepID=A0A512BV02_9HYPH|nr:type II toxin-antitoxin system VapC family toxin [Microvirga aerophila]GEO15783.1 DNA-binding protein [Microvirga aerophila]
MLAIDTNVIVRYLTADHPVQAPQARALIDGHEVFVGTTVLLETEWVLRSAYGYSPVQVGEALRGFAGLPRVTLEDPALAATALDWMGQGMDFADALHLAKAEGCTAFVTFDRPLARAAKRLAQVTIRQP